jgi:acyl dehydratase
VSEGQFGVASMPVQGAVVEAGVTPMMVNWLRSAKPWLYGGRQESKFIQIVKPGDTLIYQGTVTEKKEEAGRKYVSVEFFAENQKGEKVVVGTARAAF